MVADTNAVRRTELAAFLRARRGAVQPEDVGLPRRGRRRVPGLKRSEVADLAAVSVTWYSWLEQGRDIRTTPVVLDALARALQLDEASRRHLRRLGGEPVSKSSMSPLYVDPNLEALLTDLLPLPAALIEPTTDIVGWNHAYARCWADPAGLPSERRNGLVIMLTRPEVRDTLVDWEEQCRETIASFRAEAAKFPGHPRFAAIIDMLMEESELFRDAWHRNEVRRFLVHSQEFHHPEVGRIVTEQMLLRPLGHTSVTLMVHRLVDPESRERVVRLLGTPSQE